MKKLLIILSILIAGKVYSQFGMNISSSYVSDDNLFKNSLKNYSNVSSTNASVFYNHFRSNSQLKLSYGLNLNSYNNYSSANNNINSAELDYAISNEDEDKLFTASLSYSGKAVKDEYNLYEEDDYSADFGYDFYYNENHSGSFSYNYNKVSYNNFSDFSYSENIFGYTSTFSWQTKTTLFLNATLGYKVYSNDVYSSSLDSLKTFWTTKGKAFGRLKKNIGSITKLDNNNFQLLISGRVAQALIENLGAYLNYSFRINLENNSRTILVSDYYFSDDNLFDDSYGFGGHEIELGFTYKAPYDITMKNSFGYSYKKYENQFPDINRELKDRSDDKLLYIIYLSKPISLFESYIETLNVYFSYTYLKNNSDINLFNYSNNIFAIGLNTTIKL